MGRRQITNPTRLACFPSNPATFVIYTQQALNRGAKSACFIHKFHQSKRGKFMADCINLKQRFGHRWRIDRDESYQAERGKRARSVDPWTMRIPCKHGHIAPHGGNLLIASTDRRGPVANKLLALPFSTPAQIGEDGANILFPVNHFREVADIIRPKRTRPPRTEAQRRATERLSKFRFKHGKRNGYRDLESPASH